MTAGPLVKVNDWYDNEWGYANRVGELAALVARGSQPATALASQPALALRR